MSPILNAIDCRVESGRDIGEKYEYVININVGSISI